MLINIHTHIRTYQENQLEIVDGEDTIGVHPWKLGELPINKKNNETCLMVGETGLDRSEKYRQSIKDQEISLRIHLETAKHFNIPIVLHCVRAHSDLLHILKEMKFQGKVLLHDFSGNAQEVKAYLKFDVYFSFRRKFELLKIAPIDRVFLETDDQIKFSLHDIYEQAGIPEEQFEKNLLTFFSDTKNVRSADVINYLRIALNSN
jgi:TatD DNase family protein